MARFKKPQRDVGLNITSLMDMFTILLVFLLKNFAAEGNILTNAENLVLPYSVSQASPKEVSVSMNATSDWVIIDDEPIVPTAQVRRSDEAEIQRVREKLDKCMAQEESMVRVGALTRVRGEIIMQMDKNIDFDVVYKLMASCGSAGYTKIRLAVMSREEM